MAATAAVHYIACHPVAGQDKASITTYPIPRDGSGKFSCPEPLFVADQLSPTYLRYSPAAIAMIANKTITFPNRYEISIVGPPAKVTYGFGPVAGVNSVYVNKTATAHAYSPGGIAPMGGSLGCLAAAANNANTAVPGLGLTTQNVVPVNYWSAGSGTYSFADNSGSNATSLGEPLWPSPPTFDTASAFAPGSVRLSPEIQRRAQARRAHCSCPPLTEPPLPLTASSSASSTPSIPTSPPQC